MVGLQIQKGQHTTEFITEQQKVVVQVRLQYWQIKQLCF